MRISLAAAGLTLLLLAGCGGAKNGSDPFSDSQADGSAPPPGAMSTTGSEDSPPNISPEAAPGVAFGYEYSFGLAADQVAPIQQRHARLCEELGRERCQVTGLDYRSDNGNVRAFLKLSIDSGLAHRFGEQALESVREAEGNLVETRVTGTDVGSGIRADARATKDAEDELASVQQRIDANRDPAMRRTLELQAANLRSRVRALQGESSQAQERIARAPVTLNYSSSAFVTGTPDFGGAIGSAWDQIKWIAFALFSVLMLLGPWALAGALVWLGVRRLRRRKAVADGPAAA